VRRPTHPDCNETEFAGTGASHAANGSRAGKLGRARSCLLPGVVCAAAQARARANGHLLMRPSVPTCRMAPTGKRLGTSLSCITGDSVAGAAGSSPIAAGASTTPGSGSRQPSARLQAKRNLGADTSLSPNARPTRYSKQDYIYETAASPAKRRRNPTVSPGALSVYLSMHVCMYTYIYVHVHRYRDPGALSEYVCMHVCMNTYIDVRTYT